MPSSVVTEAFSATRLILMMQARTTLPSRITVHAPHWPLPQPTFTLVSCSWLRSTSTRRSLGLTSRRRAMPLTMRVLVSMRDSFAMISAWIYADAGYPRSRPQFSCAHRKAPRES